MVAVQNAGGAIDLPADMQRELRDLEARGDRLTHYELLGITAAADGADIRRAYLEKSRRFHPDAWFRKDLGLFAPLLSKWFQKLASAYQVLSDEESRAGYDQEHKAELTAGDREAVAQRALSRIEEERRSRERRERLLRTKGFARIGAARKLYEEALEHVQSGVRSQAIAALKVARELDPNRKEISAKLIELEREQARARAHSAFASAKEREERKQWEQAVTAYAAAYQLEPGNSGAALGAARCAMENGDLRSANTWASRAVELMPGDVAARMLLARIYVALNMKARARAELTVLLNHKPDDKEARALLRAL